MSLDHSHLRGNLKLVVALTLSCPVYFTLKMNQWRTDRLALMPTNELSPRHYSYS